MSRLLLLASFALAGCLSPGTSDPSTIWELNAVDKPGTAKVRVLLPSALRRPTLVTQAGAELTHHDLDRWGTPLNEAMARTLSAELDGLPVISATIDVRELRVGMSGSGEASFVAQIELDAGPNNPTRRIEVKKGVVVELHAAKSSQRLKAACAGYATLTASIASRIRDAVAEEQGEVAKPAPSVTVPGR